jgi:hypothetical protein
MLACPGHPLLDAALDLTLERHRDLLRRGTVLVDERDPSMNSRVLFFLEHAIQDASLLPRASAAPFRGACSTSRWTPRGTRAFCTTRPTSTTVRSPEGEPAVAILLARPECAWITRTLEQKAQSHAIAHIVPEHSAEVRGRRLAWIEKTRAAVKDRLIKEITYWDHRAEQLKLQEQAGRAGARLNSHEARRRADDLQARLHRRLAELDREVQALGAATGGAGRARGHTTGLVAAMTGRALSAPTSPADPQASAARTRAIVMAVERALGFDPTDREFEKLGYDIESRDPRNGRKAVAPRLDQSAEAIQRS